MQLVLRYYTWLWQSGGDDFCLRIQRQPQPDFLTFVPQRRAEFIVLRVYQVQTLKPPVVQSFTVHARVIKPGRDRVFGHAEDAPGHRNCQTFAEGSGCFAHPLRPGFQTIERGTPSHAELVVARFAIEILNGLVGAGVNPS